MQLSQTLSSAIAQIKVSNSPITNHTKKSLPQCPPPFFQFLYNLKDKFLVHCFNGGGLFSLWQLLLLKKNFEGLIDIFHLKGGSSPGKFWKI